MPTAAANSVDARQDTPSTKIQPPPQSFRLKNKNVAYLDSTFKKLAGKKKILKIPARSIFFATKPGTIHMSNQNGSLSTLSVCFFSCCIVIAAFILCCVFFRRFVVQTKTWRSFKLESRLLLLVLKIIASGLFSIVRIIKHKNSKKRVRLIVDCFIERSRNVLHQKHVWATTYAT